MPKTGSKYDWDKLRAQFITGDWTESRQFCLDVGLPDPRQNSFIQHKISGWSREKKRQRLVTFQSLTEKMFEEELENTRDSRIRQAKIARKIQDKALAYLESEAAKIQSVETARKLLDSGIKMERDALGMTEKVSQDKNLTQNIINFTPLIEGLDDKNLADLIARLGAIRRQVALPIGVSGESATQPTPLKAVE